jgi:intracellular septation protein
MRHALGQLFWDLLSALLFVLVFSLSGNLLAATLTAVLVALGQTAYALVRKRSISAIQWLSLALVIGLSLLTLITKDSRYVRLKPSIAHVAIGCVMLKRGWLQPYLPQRVQDGLPQSTLDAWGFAWAGLMFLIALANLGAAQWLSVPAWGVFVGGLGVLKLAFFAVQYLVLRAAVRSRMRTATESTL